MPRLVLKVSTLQDDFATRASLLRRVKDTRDHASWQEFVRCYAPLVQRWAERRGLQSDDAEEAVCRVLLRLYEYLPNLDYDPDRGKFRSYLYQTLRSVISEMFRETNSVRTTEDTAGQYLLTLQTDESARDDLLSELVEEHRFHYWQEAKKIARSRCEKDHVWQAWLMTREEQLTPKAAADKIGIKLAALYMYVSRVNEYIREEFQKLDK